MAILHTFNEIQFVVREQEDFLRQFIAAGNRKDINLQMLKFLDSDTLSRCYWGSFTNHRKSQTNAIKCFLSHVL